MVDVIICCGNGYKIDAVHSSWILHDCFGILAAAMDIIQDEPKHGTTSFACHVQIQSVRVCHFKNRKEQYNLLCVRRRASASTTMDPTNVEKLKQKC